MGFSAFFDSSNPLVTIVGLCVGLVLLVNCRLSMDEATPGGYGDRDSPGAAAGGAGAGAPPSAGVKRSHLASLRGGTRRRCSGGEG